MRIAIVNWSRRRVGGVETYLSTIISELHRAGHEIAFWHEVDVPTEREQISLPRKSPAWCVAELGVKYALAALGEWRPDVIYTHKLLSPELETEIIRIAPAVFFAHDYHGTCISGTKTFKYPIVKPCHRRFGWQCLAHYYPHRCGGLSPVTMLKLYRLQSRRLELLHRYDAIVTHSDHMLSELIKHGLSAQRAYNFPYYVEHTGAGHEQAGESEKTSGLSLPVLDSFEAQDSIPARRTKPHWHLLFSGRMEFLKGGHTFLDALPQVAAAVEKPLRVTFAGDGRERRAWQTRAARVQSGRQNLEIEFTGWADRNQVDMLLKACDLLVVPSVWPEPFGLVGPEAGLRGVPVVAFAVGGIPDWLVDGVNGYLAPGDPPTPAGLAEAILHCLRDPARHARLRLGAIEMAKQFNIKNHLSALLGVFEHVIARPRRRPLR